MTAEPLQFHLLNAFIVDENPHSGNQASVVLFPNSNDERSKDEKWMTLLARDFNFSESAYLVPLSLDDSGKEGEWGLRWFTPEVEAELCGHATLASSKVLFSLNPKLEKIKFQTKYRGILEAIRLGDEEIEISLPSIDSKSLSTLGSRGNEDEIKALTKAFGLNNDEEGILGVSEYTYNSVRCLIIQLDEGVDVQGLKVDIKALVKVVGCAVITQVDKTKSLELKQLYVNSRVFCPDLGIDEDPVTGSTHADLTGYYLSSPASKYIPKQLLDSVNGSSNELTIIGNQKSKRGGKLICNWVNNVKVRIKGRVHEFAKGTL